MSSEEELSPPREPVIRTCPGAPRKGRDPSFTDHIVFTPRKLFTGVSSQEDQNAIPKKSTLQTIVRPNRHVEQTSETQTGK